MEYFDLKIKLGNTSDVDKLKKVVTNCFGSLYGVKDNVFICKFGRKHHLDSFKSVMSNAKIKYTEIK